MLPFVHHIRRSLPIRLSLMIVIPISVLLMGSLAVMLHYSRKTVKEEALNNASLSLDGTMRHIDNVLLHIEQATGNIYWDLLQHLDQPDRMLVYCQRLLESSPDIAGCAIAFEPYHYPQRGKHFMAYVYREKTSDSSAASTVITQSETFGSTPYDEQTWYTTPLQLGHPCWSDPLRDTSPDGEKIATYSLPIYDRTGRRIGVMGVDLSLARLSAIVQDSKPSPNSYCTLLGSNGSYIVHPDTSKLHHTVASRSPEVVNESMRLAVDAMMSGQTGYTKFQQPDGTTCYVFHKAFHRIAVPGRTTDNLHWSVGVIYPEDDIFGDYQRLLYYVLAIVLFGILLLLACCRLFIHRQMRPLQLLTESAQHIANGHFSELIPTSQQYDEIGSLQNHFRSMQLSLATHVGKLDQLTDTLNERHQMLHTAYSQIREADRMQTAFLHNMTNQMIAPTSSIDHDVGMLVGNTNILGQREIEQLTADIQRQSQTITLLLDHLLEMAEHDRKADNDTEDSL